MKNIFYRNFAIILTLLMGFIANAQTTPPPPPPGEEGDIGGITQPIDNYVVWLLLLGVVMIYAFMKQYNKHLKNI